MIVFNRLNDFIKYNSGKVVREYDQTIFTFDIENSNGYIIDGVARPFDYSKPPAYYADIEKTSILYLWQFGVDDIYFYGRKLTELKPTLDYLSALPYKTIIWVHNLSHEFMFLLNIIKFDTVFARKAHKIIKCTYGNIEFRCTYMLTRQSLAAVGHSVGLEKLDTLDYDDIKTPDTPLYKDELQYGSRDIEIVYHRVLKFRDEYKTLQKIPLTQTGRPRTEVKKLYASDMSYHYKMAKLLPRNAKEYARLRLAFVGGWVHSNYFYVGVNLLNAVKAYDITSSYPTQMVLRKYPMTAWTESPSSDYDFYLNNDDYCEILEIRMTNVKSAGFNDYLSFSKVYDDVNVKAENGRIYKADAFTVTVTSVDYEILKECYNADFEILHLWYSRAGYLDKRYVEYILQLYGDKVTLTGDPDKKELRARSKEILNSLYGMMVSALYYDEITFDGKEFSPPETDPIKLAAAVDKHLDDLRAKPYKVFLSFSHGVFTTAWARYSLWQVIKKINKGVVYHDTDSIYCVGDNQKYIDEYNDNIKRELIELCKRRHIDERKLHPPDSNGVEQWLGIYVCDNDEMNDGKPFAEFKTLGSKRYCYRVKPNDEIKITVAGVSKTNGVAALKNDISNFKDGLVFGYKECNKLLPHYNTEQPTTTWIDRNGRKYVSRETFGITLQPARYALTLGQSFIDVLSALGSLSNQFSEMEITDLVNIARSTD